MTYINIQSTPEAFGLTVDLDVDKSSGVYEFDTFIAWRDQAGGYCWAEDSGCSCPVPFDDVTLATVARGSKAEAANDARAWLGERPDYDLRYWESAKAAIDKWADA